eukprot:6680601-Prymnesium_polylepis.1
MKVTHARANTQDTYSTDVGDHHCTPPTAGGGSHREKSMQTCSHRFGSRILHSVQIPNLPPGLFPPPIRRGRRLRRAKLARVEAPAV